MLNTGLAPVRSKHWDLKWRRLRAAKTMKVNNSVPFLNCNNGNNLLIFHTDCELELNGTS